MSGQRGFFDIDERYATLSAAGDPLQRLASVVDFEAFRPVLDTALARSDRGKGGRPPYDAVLMLKVLVLQALYSLSDEQAEFQLRDRLSFMRFVRLELHEPVPTPHGHGSARPSSTCLPGRSIGWRCSSAPSGWHERG